MDRQKADKALEMVQRITRTEYDIDHLNNAIKYVQQYGNNGYSCLEGVIKEYWQSIFSSCMCDFVMNQLQLSKKVFQQQLKDLNEELDTL